MSLERQHIFKKFKGLKKMLFVMIMDKEKSPTGFEPQSFTLTSQHYVFSSSPVYSLQILTRGRGHMF